MKKVLVIAFVLMSSPSYAWYDAYGGFTCGYMDPLTSFLDSIFGPPCPPPMAVAPVATQGFVAAPAPVPPQVDINGRVPLPPPPMTAPPSVYTPPTSPYSPIPIPFVF
jgi:hypothetical protein